MTPCIIKDTYHQNGYSTVRWEGKTGLSHRKAYADAHGLSRSELSGVVIRHTCDNRKCVNPEHLIPGTQLQNMQDRKKPGNKYKKLSVDEVDVIREELCNGATGTSLARRFGVTPTMICNIKRGRAWN